MRAECHIIVILSHSFEIMLCYRNSNVEMQHIGLNMVGDLFQNSTENICSTSRVCIHIQEKDSFNFNKFIHIQEKYSYST